MRTIKVERIGIIVIFLLSVLLHFAYTYTGFDFFRIIAPVNESVWEHMKMMYFAGVIYIFIEMLFSLAMNNSFFLAKLAAEYVITFTTPMLYYTYSSFIGKSIMWIDILIAFIAVVVAQYVSYKIILNDYKINAFIKILSIALIGFLGAVLVYFSLNPLNTPMFISPN